MILRPGRVSIAWPDYRKVGGGKSLHTFRQRTALIENMKLIHNRLFHLIVGGGAFAAVARTWVSRIPFVAAAPADRSPDIESDLQAFAAIEPIDTHVHSFKSDPAMAEL